MTTLVVMDPIGNVPVFLTLTAELDRQERRRAAFQATATAAVVVFAFALFGQELLRLLGISVASLEVAGGAVLALAALELIGPLASAPTARSGNVALVPLGTPLLAGPGAIAATMVYIRKAHGLGDVALVLLALAATLAVIYVALRFSHLVGRFLTENGIQLISKVVGLLLAAIAVQMVATGVQAYIRHGVG